MFDWIQSDIVPQLSAAVQVAIATVLGGIVGLTTGTSLLLVGGIGIAVAVGMLYLAIIVTVLALVLLRLLWFFETKRKPL